MLLFCLKALVVLPWFLLASLIGLVMDLVRWGDPSNGHRFASLLSRAGLPLLGIRLDIRGREHLLAHQPCVYVANHQSDADIFIHGAIYPPRTVVIGKKEVIRIPIFGWFFAGSGNILIDRQHHEKAMKGMEVAADNIKQRGVSVWVFAEGHRNPDPPMLPFKKGAFHLAHLAGVPIVPVVAQYYRHVVDQNRKRCPGGTIAIHVLEPIDPTGRTPDQLLQMTRSRMEEELSLLAG